MANEIRDYIGEGLSLLKFRFCSAVRQALAHGTIHDSRNPKVKGFDFGVVGVGEHVVTCKMDMGDCGERMDCEGVYQTSMDSLKCEIFYSAQRRVRT